MDDSSNLHAKLKDARKQKNISQAEVAAQLNISRQAISRWENGYSYPDIKNLTALCKIYDLSIDELLGKAPSDTYNRDIHPTKEDTASFAETSTVSSFILFLQKFESFIYIGLLLVTCYVSFVGLFVSVLIFIRTLWKRKEYRFVLFLSIVAFLLNLRNVLVYFYLI